MAHFGTVMPVLFIYTTPEGAAKIRNSCRMGAPGGAYFDPASAGVYTQWMGSITARVDNDVLLPRVFLIKIHTFCLGIYKAINLSDLLLINYYITF